MNAPFLAQFTSAIHQIDTSEEEPVVKKHITVNDGYKVGGDWFAEKATACSHPKGMW